MCPHQNIDASELGLLILFNMFQPSAFLHLVSLLSVLTMNRLWLEIHIQGNLLFEIKMDQITVFP